MGLHSAQIFLELAVFFNFPVICSKEVSMSVCFKSSFFLLFPGLELLKYLFSFVTLSMLLVNSIWPLNSLINCQRQIKLV